MLQNRRNVKTFLENMRSEFSSEKPSSHQNQFVENLGQSVANALFGYSTGNENSASNNEEDVAVPRPSRAAKKTQQVYFFFYIHKKIRLFIKQYNSLK